MEQRDAKNVPGKDPAPAAKETRGFLFTDLERVFSQTQAVMETDPPVMRRSEGEGPGLESVLLNRLRPNGGLDVTQAVRSAGVCAFATVPDHTCRTGGTLHFWYESGKVPQDKSGSIRLPFLVVTAPNGREYLCHDVQEPEPVFNTWQRGGWPENMDGGWRLQFRQPGTYYVRLEVPGWRGVAPWQTPTVKVRVEDAKVPPKPARREPEKKPAPVKAPAAPDPVVVPEQPGLPPLPPVSDWPPGSSAKE
jgi:hypothetical protein